MARGRHSPARQQTASACETKQQYAFASSNITWHKTSIFIATISIVLIYFAHIGLVDKYGIEASSSLVYTSAVARYNELLEIFFPRNSHYHYGGAKKKKAQKRYADGTVFVGDVINGKSTGKGVLRFGNGDRYEGDVNKAFEMDGRGTYSFKDGRVYQGEVKRDAMNGKGILTHTDGNIYGGDFQDGEFHDHGVFKFSNGDSYDGQFERGLMHGTGRLIRSGAHSGPDVYTGQFHMGSMHGYGNLQFANGDRYIGEFVDHYFQGKGVFRSSETGELYEGEFRENFYDGKGILWSAGKNGKEFERFEGEFVRGKRQQHPDRPSSRKVITAREYKDRLSRQP